MRRTILVSAAIIAAVSLAGCMPMPPTAAPTAGSATANDSSGAEQDSSGGEQDPNAVEQVWPRNQASHGVVFTADGVLESPAATAEVVEAQPAEPHAILYVDFQCPHCADFEARYGVTLHDAVADGTIALEVRALSFLDNGDPDGPSTRAAGAFAAVADETPEAAEAYAAALFASQANGFAPEQLRAIAASVGADSPQLAERIFEHALRDYAVAANETGLTVPPPGASEPPRGTPALYLNGEVFTPQSTDPQELLDWIAATA